MDPKFKDKLLDRLAELVKHDDGERLMEHLAAKASSAGAQARLRQKRKDELGLAAFEAWVPKDLADDLKKEFPTSRGGIDWAAVAQAAMDHKRG